MLGIVSPRSAAVVVVRRDPLGPSLDAPQHRSRHRDVPELHEEPVADAGHRERRGQPHPAQEAGVGVRVQGPQLEG
jgi:hypothetical protein